MVSEQEFPLTNRGFAMYDEFKDAYGSTIRVQESSNIYGGIWIYCKNTDGEDWTPHLSNDDARRLVKALRAGIKHQADLDKRQRREWGDRR
jgi:hypothetical protein